jgi:hypothetical protein
MPRYMPTAATVGAQEVADWGGGTVDRGIFTAAPPAEKESNGDECLWLPLTDGPSTYPVPHVIGLLVS